ncbi:MAG: hypothetical protein KIT14_21365 [bacterium]|nr:hypothetical protein [bacterium]
MAVRRLIHAATPPPRDLWPRLCARLAADDERLTLELPAFDWRWRLAAAATAAMPFLVPHPVRFLTATGFF